MKIRAGPLEVYNYATHTEQNTKLLKKSARKTASKSNIILVFQGELEPAVLMSVAEKRLESVCDRLLNRKVRLREFGDYHTLQTWLLHVRGVGLTRPLRLATPLLNGTDYNHI